MEQIERNRELMRRKGYEVDEPRTEEIVPEQVLEEYERAKADSNGVWDELELEWNLDGTLDFLVAYQNGEVLFRMDFAWDSKGFPKKIMRS